jgi:hypothetical protein
VASGDFCDFQRVVDDKQPATCFKRSPKTSRGPSIQLPSAEGSRGGLIDSCLKRQLAEVSAAKLQKETNNHISHFFHRIKLQSHRRRFETTAHKQNDITITINVIE